MLKSKIFKIIYKFLNIILSSIILIYILIILILFYLGPIETFIVKQKLKKNNPNIIVSFTTTPYRINQIKPVLDSIIRQSIKPNKIYVNIPWKFKRDNSLYIIPEWLKNYPNVIINRTRDYGPGTKIVATLEKVHDPNAIIITFDDDKFYPKHTVRDLAKQYLVQPNAAFTGGGLNFLFGPNHTFTSEWVGLNGKPSLVVIGALGAAYKRNLFKEDIFGLVNSLPLSCFLSDDLMISAYLIANNINIFRISSISFDPFIEKVLLRDLPSAFTIDALSYGANGVANGSNESNYCYCLEALGSNNSTLKYQKAIFNKSKSIHDFLSSDIYNIKVSIIQLRTYFLEQLLEILPFFKQLIILFLG